MATVHLLISGKVQGVFYRATAKEKALALNLNGWIKNTTDGNVEAVVSGDEAAVKAFVDWCRQGPDRAEVEHVSITPKPDDGLTGFQVFR
jgi:acylphosphatase